MFLFFLFSDSIEFFSLRGRNDKPITVGDVGHVTVGSFGKVDLGVERLYKKDSSGSFYVDGFVLGDNEVKLQIPTVRFESDSSIKVKDRKERTVLNESKDRAFKTTVTLCQDSKSYRSQLREMQLSQYVRKEVQAALIGKGKRRTASLGVCSLENDLHILGLEGLRKKEYSYRNKNIQDLDPLLGDRWDIQKEENIVKFVTSISFQGICRILQLRLRRKWKYSRKHMS